jgi:hypothetical protein
MNPSTIFLHPLAQRVEIKRLQRAFRFNLAAFVGDQELAIDEINVGLNAAKAVVERVKQRPRVLVIVVSVGMDERRRMMVRRFALEAVAVSAIERNCVGVWRCSRLCLGRQ